MLLPLIGHLAKGYQIMRAYRIELTLVDNQFIARDGVVKGNLIFNAFIGKLVCTAPCLMVNKQDNFVVCQRIVMTTQTMGDTFYKICTVRTCRVYRQRRLVIFLFRTLC